MDSFAHIQDVLGQLPFLKTYSHLLLGFPHPEGESRADIEARWTAATLQLTSAFPWLAGKVVQSSNRDFIVVPCSHWAPPQSIVRFKDCSHSCPSYQDLVASRGPISHLDGTLLASRKAFPESYQETDDDPAPVLTVQVNFINGGLLVNCAAQHNIIDMSGIEQCLRLLATAMRGESFHPLSVEQGNRDRRTLLELLKPGEVAMDHTRFIRDPSWTPPPPVEPDSIFSWRYYRFSKSTLNDLKQTASKQGVCDDAGAFVSTNDALSAFCWQRITAARLERRRTPNARTKFCRAVNARPATGISPEYMGNLVMIAMSTFTFRGLVDAPLGTVAAAMRKDLLDVNHKDYIRSFATFIATQSERRSISFGGKFNPDTDIGSSSWAHLGLSAVEFGVLGKPSLVRRPNFAPLKSDVYFMPRTENGDIDALLCLNQGDFDGLGQDEEWKQNAEYIG